MSPLSHDDRWAIHDLHAKYVIGLDLDDVDAVADLFLLDGSFDTHNTSFVGRKGIEKLMKHAPHGMHLGGHVTVEPAEFGATACQQLVFVDAADHSMRLAIYDDEIVKLDGRWRFRRRICRFMVTDGSLEANP